MTPPNGTFDSIEPYLADLDARLDPDVEDALFDQWVQFVDGRFAGDVFSPRRQAAAPPGLDWPSISVNLALVDRPDLVHAMLELITKTYIAVMNAWESLVPPAGGHAVHWRMMHRGRIMIRDDSAMNISPEMVDEFARPYDQRLLDTFGGGAVHFCGRGDHYIASYGRLSGLGAIAMSQPELNDMEAIYRSTVDRGIALLGLRREAADAALSAGRDLYGLVHCW